MSPSNAKEEWLYYARRHEEKLGEFVRRYTGPFEHESDLPITAKDAEAARQLIVQQYAAKAVPFGVWEKAMREGDIDTIYCLLSRAWFGVPESIECWTISGFREAVKLLEDYDPEEFMLHG